MIRSRRAGFYLLLILLVSVGLYRLAEIRKGQIKTVQRDRCLMGTVVSIKVYCKREADARQAVERAFQRMERLEEKMSHRWPGSDVRHINTAGEDVLVSQEVVEVISRAKRIAELTDGAFDPTIGVVSRLWGFDGEDHPHLPAQEDIRRALPLVNFSDILIDSSRGLVRLARPGQWLDLGGVAKGYAVDRAVEVLVVEGIQSGIINAGGDIKVFGVKPKGHPWRIAIRHPRSEGRFVGYITLMSGSVATSGDYQRCFFVDGERYHHLLDPATGQPARGCLSATVTARTATEADALATAAFVLGPQRGIELLEGLPDVDGIILYQEGEQLKAVMTHGMERNVELEKGVTD